MGFIVNLIDPLEQFSIITLFIFKQSSLISINTFTINIFIICLILILFILISGLVTIFDWYNVIIKLALNFVKNIRKSNLNISVQIFLPFIFFTFLFIFFSNMSGMIPYSFTVTSHLSLTFFLSLSFFIGVNIFGILNNGFEFLNIFLPSSSPVLITPLLLMVEFVSYIARVFSLSIRLFANMMAGHALMKILSGFCWKFLMLYSISGLGVFFIVFSIIFCVVGLEFLIAFLQAYVFFMLMVVYLNDLVNTNH